MPLVRLHSVLWRKINDSSYQTLDGTFNGQYEIRLGSQDEISDFLADLPEEQPTPSGGFTKRIPLSAFDGDPSVGSFTLDIAKRGPNSKRGDWNIVRQQTKPYPLWQLSRLGNPGKASVVDKCYLIICKDIEGHYHARWLDASDVANLPGDLRSELSSRDVGAYVFSSNDAEASRVLRNLRSNLNVLLYGPPATGKTHLLNKVIRAFTNAVALDTSSERNAFSTFDNRNTRVAFLTFHQSYTYEEFMVSLMPTDRASHSLLSLEPRQGVLVGLARFAMERNNEALLVIDEINRGNVSRIFGEFITVMERDKRLGDSGEVTPTTVFFRLPYYDVDLAFPLRLYTLATMNSVDHSVAPLDAALRRRFEIVELMPDLERLAQQMEVSTWESEAIAMPITGARSYKILALRLLRFLNDRIAYFRGTEYQIGQWYLAPMLAAGDDVGALRDALHEAWWERILPQLEELFAGQVEQLVYILELRNDTREPMFVDEPSVNDQDMGARQVLRKSKNPEALDGYFVRLIEHSNGNRGGRAVAPAAQEAVNQPDGGDASLPEAQMERPLTDAAPS